MSTSIVCSGNEKAFQVRIRYLLILRQFNGFHQSIGSWTTTHCCSTAGNQRPEKKFHLTWRLYYANKLPCSNLFCGPQAQVHQVSWHSLLLKELHLVYSSIQSSWDLVAHLCIKASTCYWARKNWHRLLELNAALCPLVASYTIFNKGHPSSLFKLQKFSEFREKQTASLYWVFLENTTCPVSCVNSSYIFMLRCGGHPFVFR